MNPSFNINYKHTHHEIYTERMLYTNVAVLCENSLLRSVAYTVVGINQPPTYMQLALQTTLQHYGLIESYIILCC